MTDHWDLKRSPWDHSPRYYPPGQHPATYRRRKQLEYLEAAGLGDHEFAGYLRERLSQFEEQESERKVRDYLMLQND